MGSMNMLFNTDSKIEHVINQYLRKNEIILELWTSLNSTDVSQLETFVIVVVTYYFALHLIVFGYLFI